MGLASPIAHTPDQARTALEQGHHGIVPMPSWDALPDIRTRIGGVVEGLDLRKRWPRKRVRTMGRVARLAAYASEQAIVAAFGSVEAAHALFESGRCGIAYGSTVGSSSAFEKFAFTLLRDQAVKNVNGSLFLHFMPHTCAANLAQFFGIKGRVVSTCSTCTSASQGIGAGYEAIKHGLCDVMVCGGAEEMHYSLAVTFDAMFATSSHYNTEPSRTPRPFDAARDGLVVGEGAGTVVLEDRDRALARGAPILAEIIGFGTNCDGIHLTSPSEAGMRRAMEQSLASASLSPDAIDYVNAHATATDVGDIVESQGTRAVFGRRVAISSTKSYVGHTLGACGALELIDCILMLQHGFLAPTRNLDQVDPRCADLDYVRTVRSTRPSIIMTNNFAFGGINTSLILRLAQ